MDSSGPGVNETLAQIFPGDSEMARGMRAFDWSATDLGPPESWPQNLRIAVSLCLTSRFPILLWWGPNLTVLYNDSYIPFLGETKHPGALGRAGRDVWGEIWDPIGPMLESVRTTGKATWSDDFLFFFARKLPREEVHVRFTCGPILSADSRQVEGIFCPCTEITEQAIGARRLETLRKLTARAAEARTVAAACREAANVLAENPLDIPFAGIYVVDEKQARATLAATAGLQPENDCSLPTMVATDANEQLGWPLSAVLRTRSPEEVDLAARGLRLRGGVWPEPTNIALVLPIAAAGQETLTGLLVAGVSPRRVLDPAYRSFFDLIAIHIGIVLADAEAYEAERQRAEALAEPDRARTMFFSNISDEFRTPLTLLPGPVEEALSDAAEPLPPVQRARFESAHRSSLRLMKLVNTLLDFSRILNLISNALKFTLQGDITVRLRATDGSAELTIEDTGTGIPADELPRIFDRFHRIEGSRGRTHEGSGIGLSLVQELVKLHGGTVRAESTSGRGSTFVVSVPLGKDHLSADRIGIPRSEASTAARSSPFFEEAMRWLPSDEGVGAITIESVADESPGASAKRARVVCADDNADVRDYIRRLLGDLYDVEAVADGEAALAAVRARPPDLVLSDVMMPRLDGFGLLRALRGEAATRTIPVILLSVRAGEESRIEGLEAGADAYLVKPFSAHELRARIGAHIAMSRLRQEALRREQALLADAQDAKKRLEAVLASVSDGFIALDHEWRYVMLNDRACASMGKTRDQVLGRTIWDLYPDTIGTSFETELRGAVSEHRTTVFEYFYSTRNRWFENRLYPSAEGLSIFFADVTERRRAEEKLKESEERFRNLADYSPVMIWVTDAAGDCTYLNERWRQFTGTTAADGKRDGWLNSVHYDDRKRTWCSWQDAEAKRQAFRLSYRLRRHDGEYRWAIDSGMPRIGPGGEYLGYVGSVLDVTQEKLREEALRESEARLGADLSAVTRLQELSTRLVHGGDTNALLLDIIEAAEALTAADMGNIQLLDRDLGVLKIAASRGFQRPFLDFFNAVHPGRASCGTAMQRGTRLLIEDVTVSPHFVATPELRVLLDAGVRAVQSTPLITRAGRLVGMLSTHYRAPHRLAERELGVLDLLARQAADWIERIEVEEALRSAKESAQQANRVKDEFLAAVSHELRTPLTGILLWCQLLESQKLGAAQQDQAMRAIREGARAQQQLVEDLLDISRMLAGEMRIDTTDVELEPILQTAVDIVRPAAEGKQIRIEQSYGHRAGRVRADAGRMQQVALNLLNNAVKFTPTGGRIDVRLRVSGANATIEIRDTGEGIAADFLPHVFERFRQADGGSGRRHRGLGLGLAIARELVELHGGAIRADSPGKGQGAMFTVELPMAAAPNDHPGAEAPSPGAQGGWRFVPSPLLRGVRALVVEDDATTRTVIQYVLQQCEADVTALANAADALREFKGALDGKRFDVVLSDLGLPEINGYDLIRQMRLLEDRAGRRGPATPAVAVTAYAREQDRTAAIAAGFNTHLSKPVVAAALVNTVARCVGRSVQNDIKDSEY